MRTIKVSDETKETIKDQLKEDKPKKKTEILNKSGDVIYSSDKETIKEAVVEAVSNEANLRGANLSGANLIGADLMNAKFYGKGGETKIRKEDLDNFLKALGIVVD